MGCCAPTIVSPPFFVLFVFPFTLLPDDTAPAGVIAMLELCGHPVSFKWLCSMMWREGPDLAAPQPARGQVTSSALYV